MDLFQTLIFSIIQGITELFPISSVAHGVFTPYIFGWDQKMSPEFLKEHFLPFVVMLHLGTALALLLFFKSEWVQIIRSVFDSRDRETRRLVVLIIVATIPAAVIGAVFQKPLTHIFSDVKSAAFFLIINGFLLYFGEKMKGQGTKEITDLSLGQAIVIGLFQSLALIPGFSRSGSSMTAGFWMGLKHEAAARFSMLLATPIILGAAILEIPKLAQSNIQGLFGISVIGAIFSGLFAYLAVWFLMRWFKKNEIDAMRPFAYYCWVVGAIILITSLFS
jgi:undecaprenyl-diphosphatase